VPPGDAPALAVSIVHYRTVDPLMRCLEALEREREREILTMSVTVTDNASGDGSAGAVAARFPWVRWRQNRTNVGFGRGHNGALRGARARHLLVLNADAAPRPGALATLVAYLDDQPDVAIVGPRLRYPDGSPQPSRRRFPTPTTFFLESTQLQRFWPRSRALDSFYVRDRSDDETQDVDWLVGACLCVSGRAAAEVGLFDERFFLYSEEMDWCRRCRALGWRIVYLPTAEVSHIEGASSRQDILTRDITFQASKLRYVAKWHGPRLAALLRGYLLAEYVARGCEESLKLALGSRVAERRARLRVIGGYLRHAFKHKHKRKR